MYDQMGNYSPDTPASPDSDTSPGWFDPSLFGPLQRFQAAQGTPGSLASVPMPPPRPKGLGQPQAVPMPPPRPFDLGQPQQPVGAPTQLTGGYRPEGPAATSAQGGPFSGGFGIHPLDGLRALFGQGQPAADGSGSGSQGFAQAHPNLPFSRNQLNGSKSNAEQGGILTRLAQLFGNGGSFGGNA